MYLSYASFTRENLIIVKPRVHFFIQIAHKVLIKSLNKVRKARPAEVLSN